MFDRRHVRGLLLALCLSATLYAQAQDFQFERISVEHGLSATGVNTIVQDQQGFMWFGTYDGLNKYDGYGFTVYQHHAEDSTSLSNNYISSLYVDRRGTLWIGTGAGLNRFDPATETFVRYRHDPQDPNSLSHDTITTICEDRTGILWIGTGAGFNRFDPATETFVRYRHDPQNPNSLSDDRVWVIAEDKEGMLWIGTGRSLITRADEAEGGGLNRFDPVTETFTRYLHDPSDEGSLIDNSVHAVYEDTEGTLWVGTRGDGLHRFERESETFTRLRYDPAQPERLSAPRRQGGYQEIAGSGNLGLGVTAVHEQTTGSGILWFGAFDGGLSRYDRTTGTLTHFEHDLSNPTSLSDNDIHQIYQDRAGVLWIATENGVNKTDPTHAYFQHYHHEPDDPNSLSLSEVRSMAEDSDGYLWIATWGAGLNRLDQKTGTVTHYRHDSTDPYSLGHDVVRSLYVDRAGYLWMGSFAGLNRLDRETGRFVLYNHDPEDPTSLSNNLVNWIHEDRTGAFWVATYWGGLNKMDREKGTFTHYRHDPADSRSLSSDIVMFLYEDTVGRLWLATWGRGLNRFDPATGHFTTYLPEGTFVGCITEDESGRLWLCTQNQGIFVFSPDEGIVTQFTTRDGLPTNSVRGIVIDDQGSVWVSLHGGLSKIDPQTRSIRNFDVTDGLQGNIFTPVSYHKSKSGRLYFGGLNGITTFFPDQVKDNPHPPDVVLIGLKTFNEPVPYGEDRLLRQHISVAEAITLDYNQNDLTFEYVGLHYSDPLENEYAYTLENYDEAWVQAGTQRTARYPKLPPGNYVFRVRAANSDGVWNEAGTSIHVIITPPWWQTWWFRLFAVTSILALVISAYRLRIRSMEARSRLLEQQVAQRTAEVVAQKQQLEEQAHRLKEMDRLKSRFFANISHEFRTPLTLILGPLETFLTGSNGSLFSEMRPQLKVMRRNAYRLLRLVNQLLDLSKLESGSMQLHARRGDVVPFVRRVVYAFVSYAERKRIDLQYHADEASILLYFEADKLDKVLYNLLSNAFKYTPEGGAIRVSVTATGTEEDGTVEICVKDSGKGIPAEAVPYIFDRFRQVDDSPRREHEGTGIGLALVKELVELHGGAVVVESEEGFGAVFIISLPRGTDHLTPEQIVSEASEVAGDGDPEIAAPREWKKPILHDDTPSLAEPALLNTEDGRETLLVIDDNADVRRYLRDCLEGAYQVVEASDGQQGLEKARNVVPDLIIADVMMPFMDGYTLCRQVKTDPVLNHIPVILLTAKASDEGKIEGLETGADDYIFKPFNVDELRARVHNLIDLRRQLRQRFHRTLLVEPGDVAVASADEVFLDRARSIVEEHMGDLHFNVDAFADALGMSPRQLQRKMRALIDQTPNAFIRLLRLKRAAQLLEQRAGTIAEVAYRVGFNHPTYFAKCFREVFGQSPSEYAPEDA